MDKQLQSNIEMMISKLSLATDVETAYQQLVMSGFKRELDNPPTTAQVNVLVSAASQYGVNPLAGELYPHIRWDGSCEAVLTREGWNRLAHSQEDYEGVEYEHSSELVTLREASEANPLPLKAYNWVEAIIFRKGHRPYRVREHLDECFKPESEGGSPYWLISPKRQLRHKAFVSALRSAYSLSSFVEPDEIKQADALRKQEANIAQQSENATVQQAAPVESSGPKIATPEPEAETASEPVAETTLVPEVEATPEPSLPEPSADEVKAISKVLEGLITRCQETGEWAASREWVQSNPKLKAHIKRYLVGQIDLAETPA